MKINQLFNSNRKDVNLTSTMEEHGGTKIQGEWREEERKRGLRVEDWGDV